MHAFRGADDANNPGDSYARLKPFATLYHAGQPWSGEMGPGRQEPTSPFRLLIASGIPVITPVCVAIFTHAIWLTCCSLDSICRGPEAAARQR